MMGNEYAGKSSLNGWTGTIGDSARSFIAMVALTCTILALVGVALILQNQYAKQPVLSMKGLAPSMSSQFFADMMGMEIRGLHSEESIDYTFSQGNVLTFLAQMLTNVNPRDPRSLIAGEIPGIRDDTVALRPGLAGDSISPVDYAPPPDVFKPENNNDPVGIPGNPSSQDDHPDTVANEPGLSDQVTTDMNKDNGQPALTTGDKNVVLIYHTHNRESYIPELKGVKDLDKAYDTKTNVTLVGKRLAGSLEKLGIGASHSATDYPTAVKDFNYNFSYKYSGKTVETAFATNRELTYFFDIHRDSQRRDLTTTEIKGKSYAQVYFIIGHRNPNWRKNEEFAKQIHESLEAAYPGLSRGIWGKGSTGGNNGEYNQSISPNNILIEIGGPENTLEECYRTADVLAQAIADLYWEAEKVNAGG